MTKAMMEDLIKQKVNEAWKKYWITRLLYSDDDPYTKTLQAEWAALEHLARDLKIDLYTKGGNSNV